MINLDDVISKSFLTELYQQTKGDMQSQVSMHEVGAAIGLAKGEAGARAEELMVAGLVELRTLAGGISITPEGLAALGMAVPSPPVAKSDLRLSSGPVVSAADRRLLEGLVEEIKQDLPGQNWDVHPWKGSSSTSKPLRSTCCHHAPRLPWSANFSAPSWNPFRPATGKQSLANWQGLSANTPHGGRK